MTPSPGLIQARHRDVEQRRHRVQQALACMRAEAAEISISAVATRARVHRSFIHRHPDLHAAVVAATEGPETTEAPRQSAISRRSLQADNANLRDRNRRLDQHVRELETRFSEAIGTQVFHRSGLGAPSDTAALNNQVEELTQQNTELRRVLQEREEELAAARETNRRLMAQLNHTRHEGNDHR